MQAGRVEELLRRGADQRTVLLRRVPSPAAIAALIASLANTAGGTLLLGVTDHGRVVGVGDVAGALQRIAQGAALVQPPLIIEPQLLEYAGRMLILIDVPQGQDPPYLGPDGRMLVRVGRRTVAATPAQALALARRGLQAARLPNRATAARLQAKQAGLTVDLDQIFDKLERLIVANAELTRRLDQANSWRGRVIDQAIGAVLGGGLSLLLYLFGLQ
ncbi:helix-turn-helix domain-containing protein [Kallotenue papyrolyticum]|uniref:AlbA family DNA-binding domain-containing protein n=1 Tax=Kallotenue papyrolyticum TaxID=1325125 RepID=UPI0004928AFB|nr:ATP-binding protein [Kallotenue papyrolyticum]